MYAYVKLLEGAQKGNKIKIPISKIKHDFKDKQFNKHKKYLVQDKDDKYYKACIMFIEDSLEDLDVKIKKARVKIVPDAQLVTDSEIADDAPLMTKSKTFLLNTIKKEKNLKEFASLMNMKELELKAIISSDNAKDCGIKKYKERINDQGLDDPVLEDKIAEKGDIDGTDNLNLKENPTKKKSISAEDSTKEIDASNSNKNAINTEDEMSVDEIDNDSHNVKGDDCKNDKKTNDEDDKIKILKGNENVESTNDVMKNEKEMRPINKDDKMIKTLKGDENKGTNDVIENETEMRTRNKDDKIKTLKGDEKIQGTNDAKGHEPNIISEENSSTEKEITVSTSQSKCKIRRIETVNVDKIQLQITEKLKSKLNYTEKKLDLLQSEKRKVEKKYSAEKENRKELETKYNECQELNVKLQQMMYTYFIERKTVDKQRNEVETDMDVRKNFVPIGFYRETDDTIHIGRGQRLSSAAYNNLLINSKTPCQFVGNTLLTVFGENVLLKSTVTGRKSNRGKKKAKHSNENDDVEDEGTENDTYEKLDPIKLKACEDLYGHWLKTVHKPIKGEIGSAFLIEFHKFNEYTSKKISYLKRPRKAAGESSKTKSGNDGPSKMSKKTQLTKVKTQAAVLPNNSVKDCSKSKVNDDNDDDDNASYSSIDTDQVFSSSEEEHD